MPDNSLSSSHPQFAQIASRLCQQLFFTCLLLPLIIPGSASLWHQYGLQWLWAIALPLCALLTIHRHKICVTGGLVHRSRRRLGHQYPIEQARRVGFGRRLPKQLPSRAA